MGSYGNTLWYYHTLGRDILHPLIASLTASRETNLQLGKILPDRSIHQLYPQLMDDSLSRKKRILWVALAQEKGSTNVALPHLINVTIKTNHKLCVHYNTSRGTAWHLDNHVEFLITKEVGILCTLKSLRIAALLDSFGEKEVIALEIKHSRMLHIYS